MYTFSPMMVANSRKHHSRVRPYTRDVLAINTNLDIQKNHYPLDFRNRKGDEARIKNTWYNQGYCRDHMLLSAYCCFTTLLSVYCSRGCQFLFRPVFSSGCASLGGLSVGVAKAVGFLVLVSLCCGFYCDVVGVVISFAGILEVYCVPVVVCCVFAVLVVGPCLIVDLSDLAVPYNDVLYDLAVLLAVVVCSVTVYFVVAFFRPGLGFFLGSVGSGLFLVDSSVLVADLSVLCVFTVCFPDSAGFLAVLVFRCLICCPVRGGLDFWTVGFLVCSVHLCADCPPFADGWCCLWCDWVVLAAVVLSGFSVFVTGVLVWLGLCVLLSWGPLFWLLSVFLYCVLVFPLLLRLSVVHFCVVAVSNLGSGRPLYVLSVPVRLSSVVSEFAAVVGLLLFSFGPLFIPLVLFWSVGSSHLAGLVGWLWLLSCVTGCPLDCWGGLQSVMLLCSVLFDFELVVFCDFSLIPFDAGFMSFSSDLLTVPGGIHVLVHSVWSTVCCPGTWLLLFLLIGGTVCVVELPVLV
ncbi:hypothetical protein Tco_0821999 [Tanacetum coccineum]|uniref:Uncharacterized protein n=1 Tax=Tanacetum coccineum TaxID=301880 RepID=A0ABQ5ADT5_9ASTR